MELHLWIFAIYAIVGIVYGTTTKRSMRTMFGESGRDEGSGLDYPDESHKWHLDADIDTAGSGDDDEDDVYYAYAGSGSGVGSGDFSGDGDDYENILLTKISPTKKKINSNKDGNKQDVVVDVFTTASSRNKQHISSHSTGRDVRTGKINKESDDLVVDIYTKGMKPIPSVATEATASQSSGEKSFNNKEKIVIGVLGSASFFLLLFAAFTFFRKRNAKMSIKVKTEDDLAFL